MYRLSKLLALMLLGHPVRAEVLPPPLAVELDAESIGCDRAVIWRALSQQRQLRSASAGRMAAEPLLTIRAASPTEFEVIFQDGQGGRIARRIDRAQECSVTIGWIAHLADNLIRDEAGELLALLSPATAEPAPTPAQSKTPLTAKTSSEPSAASSPSPSGSPPSRSVAGTLLKKSVGKIRAGTDHWGFSALAGLGLEGSKLATPGGRIEVGAVYRRRFWSIGPKLTVGRQSSKTTVTALPVVAELRIAPLVPFLVELGAGVGFDYQKRDGDGVMGTVVMATDRLVADLQFVGTVGYPVSRGLDLIARVDYDLYLPLQTELGTLGITAGLRGRIP